MARDTYKYHFKVGNKVVHTEISDDSEPGKGLSGLLAEVQQGETVVIMQQGRPVARITRCDPGLTDDQAAAELVRSGLADPPEAPLDVDRFLATPRPRLANGLSVSELVVAERRAGR